MEPDSISEQDEQKNGRDRPDQKRFTRKKLCLLLVTVLVILMALFFYAVNIYHTPDLNELPARSKLAKLPESIKNLQVDTRPSLDNDDRAVPNTGELFIRFEAKPNDIDNFIIRSRCIDKNIFRPLVPLLDGDDVPAWWPTAQTTSGRMYRFRMRDDIHGMVAVYDDSNTVRIFLWYIVNPQLRNMQINFKDIYEESVDFLEDVLHEVMDLFD
jgi:hypothetical protein